MPTFADPPTPHGSQCPRCAELLALSSLGRTILSRESGPTYRKNRDGGRISDNDRLNERANDRRSSGTMTTYQSSTPADMAPSGIAGIAQVGCLDELLGGKR